MKNKLLSMLLTILVGLGYSVECNAQQYGYFKSPLKDGMYVTIMNDTLHLETDASKKIAWTVGAFDSYASSISYDGKYITNAGSEEHNFKLTSSKSTLYFVDLETSKLANNLVDGKSYAIIYKDGTNLYLLRNYKLESNKYYGYFESKKFDSTTSISGSNDYLANSSTMDANFQVKLTSDSYKKSCYTFIFEAIPVVQYAKVQLGDYDTTKGTASITGVTLNETFNSGIATSNATKELTLTATPNEGYKLKGWKLNGSDITVTNDSYTLTYFGTEEKPGVYEFTPVFAEKGTLAGTPYYITYGSTNYLYTSGTTPSIKGGTTKQTWGIAAKEGQFQIQTLSNENAYNMCLTSNSTLSLNTDESSYTAYIYYTSDNKTATKATSIDTSKTGSYIIVFKNSSNYYMLQPGTTPSLKQINKSSGSNPKWKSTAGSSDITLGSSSTTTYNVKFVEAPNFFGKVTANATTGGKVLVDANSTASTSASFAASSEQTWGAMKNNEEKTWYFHAKADTGYEFMAWAEDAAGKKAVSKNANFQVKVTATSDDENNPTAKQYYAIFRKTGSGSSLGTNEYYIINGTSYLSEHASDGESILLSSDAQAWTFTYSSNRFTIKGKEYLRCENQSGYVFNTSGSSQNVYVFDKNGNVVTSITSGNYYYLVQNNYLMSNQAKSYSTYKGLAATEAKTSGSGSSMRLTVPTENAENYQFTITKTELPKPIEVTVSSAGYATYCSDKDLVVPADETVFGAKSKDDVVSLIPVDEGDVIKAGEGIIIKKIGGGTVTFNISKEAGVAIAENQLKGTTKYEEFTQESIYLLGVNDGNAAFMLNKGSYLLAPNKAYLDKPANAKQILYISEDTDDATAINSVSENLSNAKMYNLNGIQVNKNYKGIVIKDGKKYLMK